MAISQLQVSIPLKRAYELLPLAQSYALGKEALNKACQQESSTVHPIYVFCDGSRVYRPLTFRENIQAQVDDFWALKNKQGKKKTLDERLRLFTGRWLDSCTSIAIKGKTSEFTIITLDEQLLSLPSTYPQSLVKLPYPSSPSIKFDSSKGKYNVLLTEREVLDHEGWLATVEGDLALLQGYSDIVFSLLKQKYGVATGMAFTVLETPLDMRMVLPVHNLGLNSEGTFKQLFNGGSFLQVVPSGNVRRTRKRRFS